MNNTKDIFHRFLNSSLRILLLIPLLGSVFYAFKFDDDNKLFSIFCLFISFLLIGGTCYCLKNNYKHSVIITIILIVAFAIRFWWFYNIDSIPIGDFNRMFICATQFADGATYMFKDYSYFARFPHMSMTVLYFSFIVKAFSNPLMAIRFINIIFSMLNILLMFFLSKEIFKDKNKSIWVLLITSIYPPMIAYNNVYCSENLAIPILILSVLMFFKAINSTTKNKFLFFVVSGLSLSIMHLFRPLGYVMIIAYIMYIFIYIKEKIKTKICANLLLILTSVLPFIIISNILLSLNITENQLWHGMEPVSVSILKGTNIESGGRWNEEDAYLCHKYDEDYENLDKAAKETIKQRLTKTPIKELLEFYVLKYGNQWCQGDFGGIYWSQDGLSEAYNKDYYLDLLGKDEGKILMKLSEEMQIYTQTFFISLLLLSYIGLYKNKKVKNYKIDFFLIMFCGLSLQCLITESQNRYTYPFSWIFIIVAITAFNKNKSISGGGGKIKVKNFKYIVKLLRPKQWIKNLFVFGPIIFSNNLMNGELLKNNLLTFISFCFISSTVYILNDIVDRDRDKAHPKKCNRPIASGKVNIPTALLIGLILSSVSLTIALSLNKFIAIIICLYILNNVLYSFKLKNIFLIDILSIALGFILRLVAGGISINVDLSKWIILCTLFLSLFLGFGKRRSEIITLGENASCHRQNLSQYTEKLLDQFINISLTCTIMSYSIYCVLGSYDGNFIWTTLFIIFGVLRYYYLMYSKDEGGNTAEIVLKDKQLYCCILCWGCACIVVLNV